MNLEDQNILKINVTYHILLCYLRSNLSVYKLTCKNLLSLFQNNSISNYIYFVSIHRQKNSNCVVFKFSKYKENILSSVNKIIT